MNKKRSAAIATAVVLAVTLTLIITKKEKEIDVVPEGTQVNVVYLPLVVGATGPIPDYPPAKANLAIGTWYDGHLMNEFVPIHAEALGLGQSYQWHNWSVFGDDYGTFVPMVYSPSLGNLDRIPEDYDGYIMFANECDLVEQCNASPLDVARMAVDIQARCGACTLIGPAYSASDNGLLSTQWYYEFVKLGGDTDRLEPSLHLYPYAVSNPIDRIDEYYANYLERTGQGEKKIHITEIGWQQCYSLDGFAFWLDSVLKDERVESVYLYSYLFGTISNKGCSFSPLVVANGVLTPAGKVARDAIENN